MWILYSIGIVFLIMFLKSIILKPILFKEKWAVGIMYGMPAILCLLLSFLLIYSDYNSEQTYFKEQSNRYDASSWQPPRVSGTETPINPKSVTYISIPIPQSKNLQDGLIALQNDLNALESNTNVSGNGTTQTSTTTATSATTNNDPKKQSYIDDNGKAAIIGDTDSKIYHLPGDPYYAKEMQKLSNNVYFRTPEEAEAAGYRAIKR